MKGKVTLSIDVSVIEEAKIQKINMSQAAEEGLSAFLGRSRHGKIQRGENGEFIMTEEVRKDIESFYDAFYIYISSLGARYTHRKALLWIFEKAVRVGMDAEELLCIFEERYSKHIVDLEKVPKIEVSQEALDKLLDIYRISFFKFIESMYRSYIDQDNITDDILHSKLKTASFRWVDVRKKKLGNISRKELYTILKDSYNDKKGIIQL